jgi:signal transduction histidine kinase
MHTHSQTSMKNRIRVFIDNTLKEIDKGSFDKILEQTNNFNQKFISGPYDYVKERDQEEAPETYLITGENLLPNFQQYLRKENILFLEKRELSFFQEEKQPLGPNFSKLNLADLDNLGDKLFHEHLDKHESLLNKAFEQSLSYLKKIKNLERKYAKYLKEKLLILKNKTPEVQIIEDLNRFEEYTYQVQDLDELVVAMNDFWFENTSSYLEFVSPEKLTSHEQLFAFPIILDSKLKEFMIFSEDFQDERFAYIAIILFKTYLNFFHRNSIIHRFEDAQFIWEDSFAKVGTPMCLLELNGSLLLHNQKFINLKLMGKECLKLNNNQSITINSKTYKVIRKDVNIEDKKAIFFTFISGKYKENKNLNPSNEELGIVSSSVAHELNNPLAGILAAISVIELEDDLSEEIRQEILEMKKGTQRCKDLIQTFLGFSRLRPTQHPLMSRVEDVVKKSFEQAFNLIRFRLIENNFKLNIALKKSGAFTNNVNPSVLAMIFYLILGEVITAYSHYLLIAGDSSMLIEGSLYESENEIRLKFAKDFELKKQITDSKLIKHLVGYLRLELDVSNEITLRASNQTFL